MGRMFRVITERGVPSATVAASEGGVALAQEPDDVADDFAPFVEVGGPEGVISAGLPEPATTPPPAAAPKLVAETTPGTRILSVAFHRLPKVGLRLVPNGVAPEVVTYHFPDHPVSREYRAVADELCKQFEATGPKAFGFTAAVAESGTTTVALNLAALLAGEAGAKVLVVDANFRRPAVAPRLGMADGPGLAEVFALTTPLAWAVQPTPVANLHALPAGTWGEGTASAMSAGFPKLVAQLRQWFDWVLVDSGVWSDAGEPGTVASACDAAFLVSRQTDLGRSEFTDLRAAVTASGGRPRGYITTRE